MAINEGLGEEDAILLQTFLGVALSIGAFSFGIVILSKSQQCMISRQYLLQASIFGIGMTTIIHYVRWSVKSLFILMLCII